MCRLLFTLLRNSFIFGVLLSSGATVLFIVCSSILLLDNLIFSWSSRIILSRFYRLTFILGIIWNSISSRSFWSWRPIISVDSLLSISRMLYSLSLSFRSIRSFRIIFLFYSSILSSWSLLSWRSINPLASILYWRSFISYNSFLPYRSLLNILPLPIISSSSMLLSILSPWWPVFSLFFASIPTSWKMIFFTDIINIYFRFRNFWVFTRHLNLLYSMETIYSCIRNCENFPRFQDVGLIDNHQRFSCFIASLTFDFCHSLNSKMLIDFNNLY